MFQLTKLKYVSLDKVALVLWTEPLNTVLLQMYVRSQSVTFIITEFTKEFFNNYNITSENLTLLC